MSQVSAPVRQPTAEVSTSRPLDVLWDVTPNDRGASRGGGMPEALATRYGGDLRIPLRTDRPTFVANFVSTVDGIVALGSGNLAGGGLISGHHEPDRFVMALLRAVSDVVLIGAGTVRGSTSQRWSPDQLKPDLRELFGEWRRTMGLAPQPTTVVVTGSGLLPEHHAGLKDPSVPVVIATTPAGAERLRATELGSARIEVLGDRGALTGHDLRGLMVRLGGRLVLSEGGPHLIGELVAADILDELFLTIAPQIVGRGDGERLGLVEGTAFAPADARWHDLVGVRRSDDHLFLRYRRGDLRLNAQES